MVFSRLRIEVLLCSVGNIASRYQQYDDTRSSGFSGPARIQGNADKPVPPDCDSRGMSAAVFCAGDTAKKQALWQPSLSLTARIASYGRESGHAI